MSLCTGQEWFTQHPSPWASEAARLGSYRGLPLYPMRLGYPVPGPLSASVSLLVKQRYWRHLYQWNALCLAYDKRTVNVNSMVVTPVFLQCQCEWFHHHFLSLTPVLWSRCLRQAGRQQLNFRISICLCASAEALCHRAALWWLSEKALWLVTGCGVAVESRLRGSWENSTRQSKQSHNLPSRCLSCGVKGAHGLACSTADAHMEGASHKYMA